MREARSLMRWLAIAASLWAGTLPTLAQSPNDEEALMALARSAMFHVDVEGTPRLRDHPLQPAARSGKAFAVGPALLVTARHVLGDPSEWQLGEFTNLVLARAVPPLDRSIAVFARDGAVIDDAVVVGAPSTTLNAAGLSLATSLPGGYFSFSFCPIVNEQPYWAVMSGHTAPDEPASVSATEPILVALTANGPGEGALGGLYTFTMDGSARPSVSEWGHDGSPIVDADGHVVAIISAIGDDGAGQRVFATPVQPLIPGSLRQLARAPDRKPAAEIRRRCSMADTVKRIHDQLNAHTIWNVAPDRELDSGSGEMRPTGNIVIEYENVAEQPNVKEIVIVYQVWGKISRDRKIGRFREPEELPEAERWTLEPLEIVEQPVDGQRQFLLEGVAELIQKYEAREQRSSLWDDGYAIEIVLEIHPKLEGRETTERRYITRKVAYADLR